MGETYEQFKKRMKEYDEIIEEIEHGTDGEKVMKFFLDKEEEQRKKDASFKGMAEKFAHKVQNKIDRAVFGPIGGNDDYSRF